MRSDELTKAEISVIRDYVRFGSLVKAAEARCRSIKTVECQAKSARAKMGGIPLIQAAILIDRIGRIDF